MSHGARTRAHGHGDHTLWFAVALALILTLWLAWHGVRAVTLHLKGPR